METVFGNVNVKLLRIRAAASDEAEVIAYSNQDEQLVVEAYTDEWLSVTNAAGISGFVMRKFVNVDGI